MPKRTNRQDATLINVQAAGKRFIALGLRVSEQGRQLRLLTVKVKQLEQRVNTLSKSNGRTVSEIVPGQPWR